jgi:transcriptional regulator with XRE-family HTH domain
MNQLAVGKRIKERREAAGLTQQQLAVKAGLSVSNLAQIEQGQKADPRISTVVALARALGVTVDDLLQLPEQPAGQSGADPKDLPPADERPVQKKPKGGRKPRG